jgi:ubiquinone/menaquinone biosynthesis C-methylase UbiE
MSSADPENGGGPRRQARVSAYFESRATLWKDLYRRTGVYDVGVHQYRQRLALRWIEGLRLPHGSCVLEVGCGAGGTSVALAQMGLAVAATDVAASMLAVARQESAAAGVQERTQFVRVDIHALGFRDNSFDLVIALGVLSWLHSPGIAAAEMARVLRPGGYLVVNATNRWRLTWLLDPQFNPWLAPMRRAIRTLLRWSRPVARDRTELVTFFVGQEVDRIVVDSGLELVRGATFGFGPFRLFGRNIFPNGIDLILNRCLQRLADTGVRGLKSAGAQYLVLARKPAH